MVNSDLAVFSKLKIAKKVLARKILKFSDTKYLPVVMILHIAKKIVRLIYPRF